MSAVLARLISDLEIAVLEYQSDQSFTLISEAPQWLHELWPATKTTSDNLNPGEAFYYLEDYLERNADFWQEPDNPQRTSGVWTESRSDGSDQLLEAVATFIEGRPLLLIRVPAVQNMWPIFQQAREQRLEYEQLVDEINKREVLLHCIVHDLSNPLAGIKGSLDLLESEEMVEPDGDELLQLGLRQAKKMQYLIGSILNTFANEVKPIVPTLIGMEVAPDIAACAHEVIDTLSATAMMKNIILKADTGAEGSIWKVVGETERLERVLFNLLANAIRHSTGGQTVTIRLRDEGQFIEASVADQGSGVPEAFVADLFERFSQGSGNSGQAGLGLYFCRITVENWGGSIGYRPAEGGGACFWFRLPKPLSYDQLPAERQNS